MEQIKLDLILEALQLLLVGNPKENFQEMKDECALKIQNELSK